MPSAWPSGHLFIGRQPSNTKYHFPIRKLVQFPFFVIAPHDINENVSDDELLTSFLQLSLTNTGQAKSIVVVKALVLKSVALLPAWTNAFLLMFPDWCFFDVAGCQCAKILIYL